MADIDGLFHAIQGQIGEICRDQNIYREEEMANMIDMLCEAHTTAIVALAGACLVTAKLAPSERSALMDTVRDLVEKSDADFSLRLRARVLTFVDSQQTPNPFKEKQN